MSLKVATVDADHTEEEVTPVASEVPQLNPQTTSHIIGGHIMIPIISPSYPHHIPNHMPIISPSYAHHMPMMDAHHFPLQNPYWI